MSRDERSGWRDEDFSRRHRNYGFNTPMNDIDFLCVEYDRLKAVALVEYKHEYAKECRLSDAQFEVLRDLARRAQLPLFLVRYAGNYAWFKVAPLNEYAQRFVPSICEMKEMEYVELLYRIRGRNEIPEVVLSLFGWKKQTEHRTQTRMANLELAE